jgi:GT2 family glycosyltransferase
MTPSVITIILNWNGWDDTFACIESCLNLKSDDVKIIVVDNASNTDRSGELLQRFPEISFIQTAANLGFAGGNNLGIRHALAQGADYVWLLNNDTVVDPAALAELLKVAQSDATIGMVGSKIVYYDNPRLLWYAGAVLDFNTPWQMHHRGLGQEDVGQYNDSEETGFVTGCSLLARREMLAEIGLLDEGYFLYFEDSDLNIRAKKAGWKLFYSPASLVYHKVSLSMGGSDSPLMRYYYSRNFLYFVNKHFPVKFASSLVYDIYEHVLVNVKKVKIACAAKAVLGICHYFKGKRGPFQSK